MNGKWHNGPSHPATLWVVSLVALATIGSVMWTGQSDDSAQSKLEPPTKEAMRAYLESPKYKAEVDAELKRIRAEETMVEEAEWFGTTGLSDDTERHVSKYLRLELGESLADPDALKASDLDYVGSIDEHDGRVHYWKFSFGGDVAYAYVVVDGKNQRTGWGGREPPASLLR